MKYSFLNYKYKYLNLKKTLEIKKRKNLKVGF